MVNNKQNELYYTCKQPNNKLKFESLVNFKQNELY